MKKLFTKMTALFLGAATLFGLGIASTKAAERNAVVANATDSYTWTAGTYATANSWSNGTAYTSFTDSYFTFSVSGGGNNGKYYTSDSTWRFYNGGSLSISVSSEYKITNVISNPTVDFTNSDGIYSYSFSATTKIKSISITYQSSSDTRTLKSISTTGQTTEYYVNDTFEYDGKCTATYDSGDPEEVTPTASSPDMTTAGTKTVTLTYLTASTSYEITVKNRSVITATVSEAATAGNKLADNASSDEIYDVTGYAVKLGTWSTSYKNGDITIADSLDETDTSKMLVAFRISDQTVFDSIAIGAKIEVKSRIQKYVKTDSESGTTTTTIETLAGPTVTKLADPEDTSVTESTVAEALTVINGLNDGAQTTKKYAVTGYIVAVTKDYSSSTNKISFTIADEADGTSTITCYSVTTTDDVSSKLVAGAQVTVTGYLEKYVSGTTTTPELVTGTVVVVKEAEQDTPSSGDNITVTKTVNSLADENGWTTSAGSTINDIVTSFKLDSVVTISTSGAANCGSIWGTTSRDWRLYQAQSGDVTVSVASGYELVSCKFTYGTSNTGALFDSDSAQLTSNTVDSVSGSSATYTVGNTGTKTNGQVRITAFEIIYKENGDMVISSSATKYEEYMEYTVELHNIPVGYTEEVDFESSSTSIISITEETKSSATFTVIGNGDATITATVMNSSADSKEASISISAIYGANSFAYEFTSSDLLNKCSNDGTTSDDTIKSMWSDAANSYGDLSSNEKTIFASSTSNSSGTNVQKAAALYDYIYIKYAASCNLTDFASRSPSASSFAIKSVVSEDNTITTIFTLVAISSITIVGGLTLSRKRKEF